LTAEVTAESMPQRRDQPVAERNASHQQPANMIRLGINEQAERIVNNLLLCGPGSCW